MAKLLDCREQRYRRDSELAKTASVISIIPNYPGADKRNIWADYAVYELYAAWSQAFTPDQRWVEHTPEGLVFTLTSPLPGEQLKRWAVELENNHPLGRLVDIDVRRGDITYSRTELGYPARGCYLCGQPVAVCSRLAKHGLAELQAFYKEQVLAYIRPIATRFSRASRLGMLAELARAIGFGCVTINQRGSHRDMDAWDFLASLAAISPYFDQITPAMAGSFKQLRAFGQTVEAAMFEATEGINTHKGAVFLYILLCAALLQQSEDETLSQTIARLAQPLAQDFEQPSASHGLTIYEQYGIRGIRGLALEGLPLLFRAAKLPETLAERTEFSAQLMAELEDTTVIHRSSLEHWQELKAKATGILSGELDAETVDHWCKSLGISTGGSADLVGAKIFLEVLYLLQAERN